MESKVLILKFKALIGLQRILTFACNKNAILITFFFQMYKWGF